MAALFDIPKIRDLQVMSTSVSTKCQPKTALKPLGRKGFKNTIFWASTRCLPTSLFDVKKPRFLSKPGLFSYLFWRVTSVVLFFQLENPNFSPAKGAKIGGNAENSHRK
jgi:hypothetical protein